MIRGEMIMKKNKLLGAALAAMILMSSIVPAFAVESATQDPSTNGTQIQENQLSEAEKLAKLNERAEKLGIDIEGLSVEEAKTKIREAVALKLGINIAGLSKDEVIAAIENAEAAKLGIDITGLSKEDAKAAIQKAREAKKQEVTEKLSEKAAKLGIDITGDTNKEAREKIKEARQEKKADKTASSTDNV
jgi:hypothetical protein